MNADIRQRINLIRDSLIGVSYHLPDPEVLLYPFLDNNLILHQAPLVYAIWEGNECVFTTLKDPDFLSRHKIKWESLPEKKVPIPKTPYTLSVHSFPVVGYRNKEQVVNIPIHQKATAITRSLLYESHGLGLSEEFFISLGKSILSQQSRELATIDNRHEKHHIEMDYAEVKAFLEPFRLSLDEIFAVSLQSKHLSIKKASLTYPNVFTVVRSSPTSVMRYNDVFNYTAGLLPLSKMKSALERWCANQCLCDLSEKNCPLSFSTSDECLNAFEHPLGRNSRSVSDLVFSSGVVDFGRQAREEEWDASVAGDPFDEQRRMIEKCIYPPGWHLFYIPIHVGGTPWLALFTFTPENPASNQQAWHHNYSFYRDLVQKTAALIRHAAHEAYSDLLAKHFVKHMQSSTTPMDTLIYRVNHDAKKLAQVYPFPIAIFKKERHSPNDIVVPGRGALTVDFEPNPFFSQQVSRNLGNVQQILRNCREEIGDFTRIEQSININAFAQLSHLLKVPLRVLDGIASSSTEDKNQSLHRQINKILDFHDATSALMSETKYKSFQLQYKKVCTIKELAQFVSNEYNTSVQFLVEPTVSGNLAPRLKQLLEKDCILFTTEPFDNDEVQFIYYEPFILALLDGLLTNAIDDVDLSNPNILVKLACSEDRKKLFLCVENTTDIDKERLSELLRNLNSPGPDMVGITVLHQMSKACWSNINSDERLSWTALTNPPQVLAKALIAEIQL